MLQNTLSYRSFFSLIRKGRNKHHKFSRIPSFSYCINTQQKLPNVPIELARRLRELTNAKLKDCKLALIENRFDMEKARQWIYYQNLNDKGIFKKKKSTDKDSLDNNGLPFRKEDIIRPQPWRVLIVDIDDDVMEEEIESALHEACEHRPIHITEIEIFQDGYGDIKRTSAFISLISQEDLITVLDENVRAFGIYIRGNRKTVKATDDRKTLLFSIPETMMVEEFLELLSPWSLDKDDLDLMVVTNNEGERTGGIKITFKNHDIAYSIWSTLKKYPSKGVRAYWNQNHQSIFNELNKTRDNLLEENISLRRKLEKMLNEHEVLYAKYNKQIEEKKSNNNSNGINENDFDYYKALHNHINNVLIMTNYDKRESSKLLDITTKRLTMILKELENNGHPIHIPEKYKENFVSSSSSK